MNCPKCNVNLIMSERQGIEIDYCPNCRGVWLDRGELDKIIERSTVQFSQPAQPSYSHGSHEYKQHDYYKHKKKNWLNELFD
ncbi:MAG TPA: zf-TFIIB domain-containing protein [Bacteroidales bacterium]|nr:zf-TFIIB domain-containing protein [Bacteroidales bacterium]